MSPDDLDKLIDSTANRLCLLHARGPTLANRTEAKELKERLEILRKERSSR